MGTHNVKATLLVACGGFALTALTACNDTGFVAGSTTTLIGQTDPTAGGGGVGGPGAGGAGGTNNTNPPGCTIGVAKKPIRVMFMVDNSGSTKDTDPMQTIRVQTLKKFITDYGANTNLTYNFAYFAGTTASAYDMTLNTFSTGTAAKAVGTSAQLSTALAAYEKIAPGGYTPYKAAFNSLTATISADETAGNKQDYAVVFLSDGQPTDISGIANLRGLVDTVTTTAKVNGSAVTVNTVYFGDAKDSTSIDNLYQMALRGAGQFVDSNKFSNGIIINDLINVPGANCP